MACFAPAMVQQFLIWLVVVVAVVAAFHLLVPWLLAQLGSPDNGVILRLLQIFVWALVIIAVIVFAFRLLACSGLLH